MQPIAGARESRATVQPGPAEQVERDPVLTVDDLAGLARWAASAGIEAENHLVANVEVGHQRARLDNDTRTFVAQHTG